MNKQIIYFALSEDNIKIGDLCTIEINIDKLENNITIRRFEQIDKKIYLQNRRERCVKNKK